MRTARETKTVFDPLKQKKCRNYNKLDNDLQGMATAVCKSQPGVLCRPTAAFAGQKSRQSLNSEVRIIVEQE